MKIFFYKKRSSVICLVCILLAAALLPFFKAEAAKGRILTLSQAQKLALANSRKYKKTKSKLALKQVQYMEAVKSVALKKKNMRTFRWTPLLSFQFPQQPALADEYEWQYKPLQVQNEINKLSHELNDIKFEVTETISNLYSSVYFYQEKIAFTEKRLESKKETLVKNKARLVSGEANQADIDKLEKSIKKLESDLSLLLRSYETEKSKISDYLKLDVSTSYRFEDSFSSAIIDRSMLEDLTEYALENDHSYYEAKLNAQLAYISLDLNQSLMRNQYGGKMAYIQSYISQAKNGQEIDTDAFKAAYDNFLQVIDRPWQGNIRILFIKIPKEWFKGKISGIRYVEDDPYALYTAALEYEDMRTEQESAEKEIRKVVSDSFEALVTAKNAYGYQKASVAEMEKELKRSTLLKRLGELPFDELESLQEEYEEGQLEEMDSLKEYNELLFSFDRQTCGGFTKYLKGEQLSTKSAVGGDSYLVADKPEGAYYYIESKIEDNLFVFGVSIPDDFSVEITGYELWVNGIQIGERTVIGKEIRHLTLAMENTEKVFIRFYNGNQFVDECEIDASVNRAELEISGNFQIEKRQETKTVASYSNTKDEKKGTATLKLVPKEGEQIAYYQLMDQKGNKLFKDDLIPISEEFQYLSILANDFSLIKAAFYDSSENLLYEGNFEEKTLRVTVPAE